MRTREFSIVFLRSTNDKTYHRNEWLIIERFGNFRSRMLYVSHYLSSGKLSIC